MRPSASATRTGPKPWPRSDASRASRPRRTIVYDLQAALAEFTVVAEALEKAAAERGGIADIAGSNG